MFFNSSVSSYLWIMTQLYTILVWYRWHIYISVLPLNVNPAEVPEYPRVSRARASPREGDEHGPKETQHPSGTGKPQGYYLNLSIT